MDIQNKDVHLRLLEQAFFIHSRRNYDGEYGSIGLDSKRPFGSSYVQGDILKIIGVHLDEGAEYSDEQHEYADKLYDLLPKFTYEQYLRRMNETA